MQLLSVSTQASLEPSSSFQICGSLSGFWMRKQEQLTVSAASKFMGGKVTIKTIIFQWKQKRKQKRWKQPLINRFQNTDHYGMKMALHLPDSFAGPTAVHAVHAVHALFMSASDSSVHFIQKWVISVTQDNFEILRLCHTMMIFLVHYGLFGSILVHIMGDPTIPL